MRGMTISIVALGPLHPHLAEGFAARFTVHALPASATAADVTADMRDARAIVTSGWVGASAEIMDSLPALEIVGLFSVGYDKVAMDHARARGIRVSNTPDVLTDDVADMAVALMYATLRNIAANDSFVRGGRWTPGAWPPLTHRVTGKRMGILGYGRIGRAIADRIRPTAGAIAYHNRKPAAGADATYIASAVELAAASDVLFVATVGGADTQHLVDRAVIDALGPDGVLINISRGSVVDQDALIAALAEGRLRGAGLDVFADEPHVPDILKAMDQVVLQPHMASATVETRTAMADLVLANLDAHFAGQPLPTPVV